MIEANSVEKEAQLNVPPVRQGALWKVIVPGIRCPVCGCDRTKALTGKRSNSAGFSEHYRRCESCEVRFRVIFE